MNSVGKRRKQNCTLEEPIEIIGLSGESILRILDEDKGKVFKAEFIQEGSQKVEIVSKIKRLRTEWLMKDGLRHLPPRDDRTIITKLTPLQEQPTVPQEEKIVLAIEETPDPAKNAEEPIGDEELIRLFGDKMGPNEEHFWLRQGLSPTLPEELAGPWRERLRNSQQREEKELSLLTLAGIAKTTRASHIRIIKWLEKLEPPTSPLTNVTSWILKETEKEAATRSWLPSTTATKLATIMGALANMPIYKHLPPILMKHSPEWRLAMTAATQAAKRRLPNQANIVTWKAMDILIKNTSIPIQVRTAIELAWVTAARSGDVIKLRKGDIEAGPTLTKVKFIIGKTATRQPYTVATTSMTDSTRAHIMSKKEEGTEGWLFPEITNAIILTALRSADPTFESRSLRRGALQHLSASGLSDLELLAYSQHASVETLRRYLNFGWVSGETSNHALKANPLKLTN